MYNSKVYVLYRGAYGRCVINGSEWQRDFDLFLQFDINVSQWNFQKEKQLINS